jgi:hypothetical protein
MDKPTEYINPFGRKVIIHEIKEESVVTREKVGSSQVEKELTKEEFKEEIRWGRLRPVRDEIKQHNILEGAFDTDKLEVGPQRRIADVLLDNEAYGINNAILFEDLETATELRRRTIQDNIAEMFRSGFAIISSKGAKGVFLAGSRGELEGYIAENKKTAVRTL